MGMKKKLSLGVVFVVLGLVLVGGGIWVVFNDIKLMDVIFVLGMFDLFVKENLVSVNLLNLKLGDKLMKDF